MSEVREFKCPCCGGDIIFDSVSQTMKCPYCDTEFDLETLKGYDSDLNADYTDNMNWDKTPDEGAENVDDDDLCSYICKSCGGEIVGSRVTGATFCPFCGNPVIISEKFAGFLKPDSVIPFKLSKKEAVEKMNRFLSTKKLLPRVFKEQNHIEEIKGIYVPFWLFDSEADADMHYRATKTRRWSDRKYDYTETDYYSITRGGTIAFENVPVDGSRVMADDLMESVEPYDMSEAVDFQTAYLSGFFADKYDVSPDESINRANQRIKASTESEFASTVLGYESVTLVNGRVNLQSNEVKYALLPVWVLHTKWNDENFVFAMNGQTGNFVGNLPLDKGAYRKMLASIFGIAAAATFVIAFLLDFLN